MRRDAPGDDDVPYREEKPLSEIIEPDRRRQRTIILVASSMVAGVALFLVGRWALERLSADSTKPPVITANDKRLTPVTLEGPDGQQRVPPFSKAVIHVWLQGCADCMPAFEAMRDLDAHGGLGVGVPEINVSYGQADPAWAARYGVRRNLVYDRGGNAVVRPLGISTFTTLVVDEDGVVLHRDRPDREGYKERIRAIVGAMPAPEPAASAEPLGPDAVQKVVRANTSEVRRRCWDGQRSTDAPASVDVKVTLRIAPDGRVSGTEYTSNDQIVGRCVASVYERVAFPAPGQATSVVVPFHFVRQ
jgi:hypothetical protein